ncbi:MAG: FAD-binding oxidoreductase [Balneolaceae bacterium]
MSHKIKILTVKDITHDVKSFILEKPTGYKFKPGQAVEVAVDEEGWRDEKRPFTFTSLNKDPHLEFIIKRYDDHGGVTKKLHTLGFGDHLLIGEPWGTITYREPGVFLAGGAGITPFISILRYLRDQEKLIDNKLLFGNKTEKDIILKDEFEKMLGDRFVNILSEEQKEEYYHGFMDKSFLAEQIDDFDQAFYVCGPKPFNESVMKYLQELGANPESLVFEK